MQKELNKAFLKRYLLQEAKISTLAAMHEKDRQNSEYYNEQILECKKLRLKIEEKINTVNDETLRELLFQKYILGKTLEEISLVINYSKRHTERLHRKALAQIGI